MDLEYRASLKYALLVAVILYLLHFVYEEYIKEIITTSYKKTKNDNYNIIQYQYIQMSNNSLSDKMLPSHAFWKINSYSRSIILKISKMREDCGELCDTSRVGTPGLYFNHTTANINCSALFRIPYLDMGHGLKKAPRMIPYQLISEFTMNKRMTLKLWYFNQGFMNNKKVLNWTEKLINEQIKQVANGTLKGSYSIKVTAILLQGLKLAGNIKNGRVLVIGSERPWVEACALYLGANQVVTLNYAKIISTHPKVISMLPNEFSDQFLNGSLHTFDAVVTFSSVEHSGLGRYGDTLNPWADIITVARAWCVTKPGGTLTIGVPWGKDELIFNAHRQYGKLRYPYLATNWKQKHCVHWPNVDPVYVFTKSIIT